MFAQGDDDDNSSYNDGLVAAPHYFYDNLDTDDSDYEIDEDNNAVGVDLNVQGDAPNHSLVVNETFQCLIGPNFNIDMHLPRRNIINCQL